MHSSRVVIRSPQVCRVVRAPSAIRPMSLFSAPQYVPRFSGSVFPTLSNEIAPLFRLMDEFAASARAFENWPQFQAVRPVVHFQPRFDVRELNDSYELRGELPGVDSNALQVEFTDAQTLVVRGTTSSEKTSGTPPIQEATAAIVAAPEATESSTIAAEPAEPAAVADNSDAASTHSASSYQKATVEDENVAEASSSGSAQPTPAESTVGATAQETPEAVVKTSTTTEQPAQEVQSQQPRYWVSERHTGSFQRVFNFPARINQEAVKASLKNGVLHINVPKASAPTSRRITVE